MTDESNRSASGPQNRLWAFSTTVANANTDSNYVIKEIKEMWRKNPEQMLRVTFNSKGRGSDNEGQAEVARMKELGWTVTSLVEETGIPRRNLGQWYDGYIFSKHIKEMAVTSNEEPPKVDNLLLEGVLAVRRAPISDEKKTE